MTHVDPMDLGAVGLRQLDHALTYAVTPNEHTHHREMCCLAHQAAVTEALALLAAYLAEQLVSLDGAPDSETALRNAHEGIVAEFTTLIREQLAKGPA